MAAALWRRRERAFSSGVMKWNKTGCNGAEAVGPHAGANLQNRSHHYDIEHEKLCAARFVHFTFGTSESYPMKQLPVLVTLALCLMATSATARTRKLTSSDLRAVARAMAGDYSSTAQASGDADFDDITLRMVPVFQKRTDGHWLYVEQAMANDQMQPYRQRVYHLYLADDSTVATQVYEIRDPSRFAGAWADIRKRSALTLYDLVDRPGCVILLRKQSDSTWAGGTSGKSCRSTVEGSSYATSEVTLYPEKLVTWDRGWNAADQQVWGAVKGGYEYVKNGSF